MSKDCLILHTMMNSIERLRYPLQYPKIPKNGIYIIFERGEFSHGMDRVVRVGTHTGEGKLRTRLSEHFEKENKDRSIFRKNIGRALLNMRHDPLLADWEIDLTTANAKAEYQGKIDLDGIRKVEQEVSKIIRENFSVAVFEVDNKAKRLEFESKIISTISMCSECKPSPSWLGKYSTKSKIRESGMWLEQGLFQTPLNEADFNALSSMIKPSQLQG